jgi:hypothetical protein
MRQNSLFDDVPGAGVATIPVIGSAAVLTKAQKQFNKLIERLNQQRQEIARWQAYRLSYDQQLADRYQPLAARLRKKRIAMVQLLDRAMQGKALSKRERAKVRDILSDLLGQLLAESEDAELVRLYDEYADVSFADERQDQMDLMRSLASDAFGVDVEAYAGGESLEELADWIGEQVQTDRPEPPRAPGRKKSAKTLAREALRDQAAAGASRAVREVFRKLVSELHPDREADPAEHVRKTELMQRVNQAYKAGDLLTLLELQLSIEQINPAALAGLAEERLRHYIHVLEEQSRRLRDERSELIAPFLMAVGESLSSKITPESVQRALESDMRGMERLSRGIDADLLQFQDIRQLKRSLEGYSLQPSGYDELATGPEEFRPRPRRRRRR